MAFIPRNAYFSRYPSMIRCLEFIIRYILLFVNNFCHKIVTIWRKFVYNTEVYRMNHEEILRKIVKLRADKNWSEYRLSMETGIPQSTISSWFRKNVQPSVQSLVLICQACGITLSQFFSSEENLILELTAEQKELLESFSVLSAKQQRALTDFLQALKADSIG